VPEATARIVREMRRDFDPDHAHLPVEIAIAGSSGLGCIDGEQSQEDVLSRLDRLAASAFSVTCRFNEAQWSPQLRAYVLTIDRDASARLSALQEMLIRSGIRFRPIAADFQPHCTIRWTPRWMTMDQARRWELLRIPGREFELDTMSIYRLVPGALAPELVHRVQIGTS